jgi:signal transduction histidine kinase
MKLSERLRFGNLPLFAKLLVPFLTLMVFVGAFGLFLIVRDLASRAEAALDQDLARRSLEARAALRDRELYLLESVNFAANLEGVAQAVRTRDHASAARSLQSVLALKGELGIVALTDATGAGIGGFTRDRAGEVRRNDGAVSKADPLVARALATKTDTKSAAFVSVGGRPMLAITAPVCSSESGCASVGVAVVGIDVDRLVSAAKSADRSAAGKKLRSDPGVALYDTDGRLLARSGTAPTESRISASPDRRRHTVGGVEVASRYTSFDVQRMRAGTFAVTVPTGPAFASTRGAGVRLAFVLLGAMLGVVAIGALLSRRILSQVRPLISTSRALGRGELGARTPVLSSDELGELAEGVNEMAGQLQASYETLELRVDQRTAEIQRLLKERTEFFAALSHELRTPLAIIRGQARMMLDPSYPKAGRWLTDTGLVIDDSAAQLLSLVNDVLDLARAEAGRVDVDLEAVSLAELVRDLRPTIDGLVRASGLRLRVHVPRDLPAVLADRARLREVIVNLVDNATKYTPDGGRIEISIAEKKRSIEVSVADTGVGIPPESRELLFEPFYRVPGTKPQRGQASSGLGLALAKRIVEAHGGSIGFDSVPGSGTTFTVKLRVARSAPKNGRAHRMRTSKARTGSR